MNKKMMLVNTKLVSCVRSKLSINAKARNLHMVATQIVLAVIFFIITQPNNLFGQATIQADMNKSKVCFKTTLTAHYYISYEDIGDFVLSEGGSSAGFSVDNVFVKSTQLIDNNVDGYYADFTYDSPTVPRDSTISAEVDLDEDDTLASADVMWVATVFSDQQARPGVNKYDYVAALVLPSDNNLTAKFSSSTSKATIYPSEFQPPITGSAFCLMVIGVSESGDDKDTSLISSLQLDETTTCLDTIPVTVTLPHKLSESSATSSQMLDVLGLAIKYGDANVIGAVSDKWDYVLDYSWTGTAVTEHIVWYPSGVLFNDGVIDSLGNPGPGLFTDKCNVVVSGSQAQISAWENYAPALSNYSVQFRQQILIGDSSSYLTPTIARTGSINNNVLTISNQ